MLDLFQGDGIPEHIRSLEFFQDIKKCLSDEGVLLSNLFMALEDQTSNMSLLATIFSVFGDVHLFHKKTSFERSDKLRLTNVNIVAPKKDHSLKIPFDLSDVPKAIQVTVFTTLKTHKKFRRSSFEGYEIISDKGNTSAYLFRGLAMHFRKYVVSKTPSRILIN